MYCLIGCLLIESTGITAVALYIFWISPINLLLYEFDVKFKLEMGFRSHRETFSS